MILKVIDSLKETKSMQFVKINYTNKTRHVKSEIQEQILQNLNILNSPTKTTNNSYYSFEHVAVIRNKPYLKTQVSPKYRISLESNNLCW